MLETVSSATFSGEVTDGLGRDANFVSLPRYAKQFREQLGYEPYPGTLNITVKNRNRLVLDTNNSIYIDGWENNRQSFGAARCYPATIRTIEGSIYDRTHVITPLETDHDGKY